jgi:CHAT domain-containing protein
VPEDSLDVGSVFLASGARAVVANMWPVDDLAAALFVSCFFKMWDWGEGLSAPDAVSAARLSLRELTVGDMLMLAEEDPRWREPVSRYVRCLDPDVKRFSEPYFWAAFAYSGA